MKTKIGTTAWYKEAAQELEMLVAHFRRNSADPVVRLRQGMVDQMEELVWRRRALSERIIAFEFSGFKLLMHE